MKITEPASAEEFEQYYELRWKILRAPWNQVRCSERDDDDKSSTHLMVLDKTPIGGIGFFSRCVIDNN